MSEVYLADSCDFLGERPRQYALKRFLPELNKNPLLYELFKQEAAIASTLHHPNIVACYEFVRDRADSFMVMEYVSGKEVGVISKNIQHAPLAERIKISLAIGMGVAGALAYVHHKRDSQGMPLKIVHGDISPQNVMVSMEGIVKLYDFGAFNDAYTDSEVVRGNYRYMSPEQKLGQRIDERSDIYSLCLVMLEAIFHDVAHQKSKDSIGYQQIIHERLALFPGVAQFLCRGLHEQCDKRFQSSHEMSQELTSLAHQQGSRDQTSLLKEVLKGLIHYSHVKNRRLMGQNDDRPVIIKMLLLTFMIFLLLALSVFYFAKMFEPKYHYKIPYWTEREVKYGQNGYSNYEKVWPNNGIYPDGQLVFKINPGFQVTIDGQIIGTTPLPNLLLPPGTYVVHIKNQKSSAVALKVLRVYANQKTDLVHNVE